MSNSKSLDFVQPQVLGHPSGLFVLFFTEMWERFSFYGMRVLLIQYLTAAVIAGDARSGLGWTVESASALYGTYVMLLYITPVFGGVLADKVLGSWKSVIIGAIIMTIGHASMAIESNATFFIGLACLVLGTGFFKPNMPSIIGEMYKNTPEKKDGGYTIFYMGVNAGAFFGMMLCGYFAERFGWHYGFGLAGIFMLLGTIQFWLAKPLFGTIGDVKKQTSEDDNEDNYKHPDEKIRNPFKKLDIILISIVSVLGLLYAFNDPISKNIPDMDMFKFLDISTGNGGVFRGQFVVIIATLILFFYLLVSRIMRYGKVVRDRMFAIIILAGSLLFFFMS
ncbi:MAG TPA: oligopeptide:H+ symporter, partial [Taishania sp.]|nr:oligopeptide:H+ symporter [Taishania sp.]